MKIEVLYVAECPSHLAAVSLLKSALAAEGIAADIHEVLVTDEKMASALGFSGSPTIRINGRDVACESPESPTFALHCRLHCDSKQSGVPQMDTIHRAVREAREGICQQ